MSSLDQYEARADAAEEPRPRIVLFFPAEDCFGYSRVSYLRRLGTSNVSERAFREVRCRTDAVRRFPGEMAALVLVWATLEEDHLVWRGVQMDGDLRLRIVEALRTADESIDLSVLDKVPGGGLK